MKGCCLQFKDIQRGETNPDILTPMSEVCLTLACHYWHFLCILNSLFLPFGHIFTSSQSVIPSCQCVLCCIGYTSIPRVLPPLSTISVRSFANNLVAVAHVSWFYLLDCLISTSQLSFLVFFSSLFLFLWIFFINSLNSHKHFNTHRATKDISCTSHHFSLE